MAITLDAISLPEDMVWEDELTDWDSVEQTITYSLTGALILQHGTRQAGRPITLSLPREHGLCDRALVLQLNTLASANNSHTLTLHDGRTFAVRWRRDDGRAVEATPIVDVADPTAAFQYALTLRFIEM